LRKPGQKAGRGGSPPQFVLQNKKKTPFFSWGTHTQQNPGPFFTKFFSGSLKKIRLLPPQGGGGGGGSGFEAWRLAQKNPRKTKKNKNLAGADKKTNICFSPPRPNPLGGGGGKFFFVFFPGFLSFLFFQVFFPTVAPLVFSRGGFGFFLGFFVFFVLGAHPHIFFPPQIKKPFFLCFPFFFIFFLAVKGRNVFFFFFFFFSISHQGFFFFGGAPAPRAFFSGLFNFHGRGPKGSGFFFPVFLFFFQASLKVFAGGTAPPSGLLTCPACKIPESFYEDFFFFFFRKTKGKFR